MKTALLRVIAYSFTLVATMMNVNQTIPSLPDLVKNNFALRARSLLSRRPRSSEIILYIVAGYHVDLGFLRKLIIRNQC